MDTTFWRTSSIVGLLLLATGCGAKSDKTEAVDDPNLVGVGGGDGRAKSSGMFYAFSVGTLYDALTKAASASTLTLGVNAQTARLALADEQSSRFPLCSGNGEPWDTTTGRIMSPASRDYPQLAFYCQFNSNDTDRTIRGSLERNKKVLCDLERVIGGPEYTAEGKIYEQVSFEPSTTCGWREDEASSLKLRNLKAKVTATAVPTGNWPHRLKMEIPGFYNITLLMRVDKSVLSVKELEQWTQDDYGRDNEYIGGLNQGLSGHLITMDMTSGLIQAEIGDTYWGVRARVIGKGTVDPATGYLKDLVAEKGLISRFNKAGPEGHSYLDALVAGLTSDGKEEKLFSSAAYICPADSECDINNNLFQNALQLAAGAKTCVTGTGTCESTPAVPWQKNTVTFGFLKIGGSWDEQGGSRGAFENWLVKAQDLKFKDDLFAVTPE